MKLGGRFSKKSSEGLGAKSVEIELMKAGAYSVKKIKIETFKSKPKMSKSKVAS